MIRELAAKSGGAQIKILSDKQSEKGFTKNKKLSHINLFPEYQECLINIAGSIANKQDASCLILEQLEIFKNGGPVIKKNI